MARSSATEKARLVLDLIKGRRVEESHQAGAGRAFMLGRDQGAADLAGDFAFAHHGGVQSGAHREEMLADLGTRAGAEGAGDQLVVESAGSADLGDEGSPGRVDGVRMRGFPVDFEAVAGGKDNGTRHGRRSGEGGCGKPGSAGAQLSNGFEVDVGVCSHQ